MKNIICPDCGIPTAFTPLYLSRDEVFNYEDGTVEAAENTRVIRAEMPSYYNGRKYAILCCQSCDSLFIVLETYGHEMSVVYPISRKSVSKDIEQPIRGEFEEACLCFAIGAYRGCAAMCQRVMESVCQDKQVASLNELHSNGTISDTLFNKATEIRLWAGIVKHVPLAEAVSKEDANQLLTYLEVILNDVYVEPKRLAALTKKRKGLKKS